MQLALVCNVPYHVLPPCAVDETTSAPDNEEYLVIALGVGIPASVIILVLILVIALIFILMLRKSR